MQDDILAAARQQVLERGVGLTSSRSWRCWSCPTNASASAGAGARGADALVRARGRGRGHRRLKTGGCPEDCHFCSQSGLFDSPVRAAWLDIPAW